MANTRGETTLLLYLLVLVLSVSSERLTPYRSVQYFTHGRHLTQRMSRRTTEDAELDSDFELEEADSAASLESEASSEEAACTPEFGYWRPGATYNDPLELITDTAIECCNICRSEERCVTWSRERRTGACALKDRRTPLVENELYDSGFPAGVRALETTTLTRCFMERGLRYPRGQVLRRRRTRNGRACCNLCRRERDCFSWHRNARSRMCVMNRNVPTSRNASNAFTGSAFI
eukprot:g4798.t1